MKLAALLFLATVSVSAQVKKPQPPPVKPEFSSSRQVIIVTTRDWSAIQGIARLFERPATTAKWKAKGDSFPVVIGRSGVAWPELEMLTQSEMSQFKSEGDGKSPAGAFPLTFAFGTSVKPEQVTFPYTRLTESTECVDDVNSHHYNKIVRRDQVGIFDWKSSEKMLSIGEPYSLGVFVAYNSYPRPRPNDGSCIFLHVWKDANTPTAGCTAMARNNLERIVTWLEPDSNPYFILLPESEYKSIKKSWRLPKLK